MYLRVIMTRSRKCTLFYTRLTSRSARGRKVGFLDFENSKLLSARYDRTIYPKTFLNKFILFYNL